MKPNFSNYPSVRECRRLWQIGPDSILKTASGSPVEIRQYARGQTVILYRCKQISPGIVAWVLRQRKFPKQRIFSLNGDNSDLDPDNWKEESGTIPDALDVAELKRAVRYDPQSGTFFWNSREPRNINDRTWLQSHAGTRIQCSTNTAGYHYFKVNGMKMLAHRCAWLYEHGKLPPAGTHVDHINRKKKDNRIDNLRAVSPLENNLNKPGVFQRQESKPRDRTSFPTQDRIKELLVHDARNGIFLWRQRPNTTKGNKRFNRLYAGTRAGRYTKTHPVLIRLDRSRYLAQDLLCIYYDLGDPRLGVLCRNGNQQDLRKRNWAPNLPPAPKFNTLSTAEKVKRLRAIFSYDARSGKFFHKDRKITRVSERAFNSRKSGREAGYIQDSYRRNSIDGTDYAASHLAILWLQEIWVPDTDLVVDHKNHDRLNNSEANLRVVTKGENARNRSLSPRNRSGHTGVRRDSQSPRKWRAFICTNGNKRTIGLFDTLEEALIARQAAEDSEGSWAGS